ncbi:MAG: hypothetical protein L0H64_02655 [Pseudonocardia sp.]|nr:hypothetical protein [Pseudonocardia sp.]
MGDVVFLDSSVLFNLLDVPGRNGERTAVVAEFKRLKDIEATFVFPVTAVIETGNAIAQLADGHSRRTCMERFVEWLRRALTATVPMAVSGVPWDVEFLESLLEGSGTRLPLVDFAMTGIGSGDASLLMEMDRYRAKVPSATPIKLWTLDALLASYG